MSKSDVTVFAVIILLAIAGFLYRIAHPTVTAKPALPTLVKSTTASAILDHRRNLLGDAHATYTLVEFGDYQCPPCRAAQKQLNGILARYRTSINFDFRNFPLSQIHHSAFYAAIVAESSREAGSFWLVHDNLFTLDLDDESIHALLSRQLRIEKLSNIQMQRARKAVYADIQLATKLGVTSTPSFFLACPNGEVYYLATLESVSYVIK